MTRTSKSIRAEDLATALLNEHVPGQGWSFKWNNRKRARGLCRYTAKKVELSKHILDDDWESIENTIRHEIAHVIAGKAAGHGPAWKSAAIRVGAKPERCGPQFVAEIPCRYAVTCTECGKQYPRHRITQKFRQSLSRRRCAVCHKGYFTVVDTQAPIGS